MPLIHFIQADLYLGFQILEIRIQRILN